MERGKGEIRKGKKEEGRKGKEGTKKGKEADLYSAYRQYLDHYISAQMWITQNYLQIHHICLSFV